VFRGSTSSIKAKRRGGNVDPFYRKSVVGYDFIIVCTPKPGKPLHSCVVSPLSRVKDIKASFRLCFLNYLTVYWLTGILAAFFPRSTTRKGLRCSRKWFFSAYAAYSTTKSLIIEENYGQNLDAKSSNCRTLLLPRKLFRNRFRCYQTIE